MERTVLTGLVERVVLPTVFVFACDFGKVFYILPEEERFLREDLEANGVSEVQEADLLVLVIVKPVEKLSNAAVFGFKTPVSDDHLKHIESDMALSMSIKLIEGFLQSFVL